jgi:hypothetical protein
MAREGKGLAPLFLPGTVRLPTPFPSLGDLEIDQGGAELRMGFAEGAPVEKRDLFVVHRRFEPSTNVWWIIPVEHVSAVLWTYSDRLDWDKADWLFGPAVRELPPLRDGKAAKGIVCVLENAPVLMRLEFGKTAIESAHYPIPGWPGCDPCEDESFSWQRIMVGQGGGKGG